MQIVKYTEINKVSTAPSTVIWEYPTKDEAISGAVAEIHGRYPEKGYVLNEKSKELVFVISGSGFVVTPKERKEIDVGDVILLQPNEMYAWEGGMTLFMATSPKFNAKQHKIIHEK